MPIAHQSPPKQSDQSDVGRFCEISTLTIPARAFYAPVAAAYVTAVAGQAGFPADLSHQLGQALLLVFKELLARAFSPADSQAVQLDCELLPLGLKISLREQGLPLTQSELSTLATDPPTCPLVQFGENSTCVRDVWDEVAFLNLGRAGAEIRLLKYFTEAEPASSEEVCSVAPAPASPSFVPGKPQIFTLRPFAPADAQAVVRLLYRTYGYSYPFEHLYYPERLIALNAAGSFQSLVAVSPQGELVGHVALFLSPERPALAELGAGVVHPDFRGHGCLRQLTDYALDEARRRQLHGLYGRPVTNHTYSQQVAEAAGFIPCGLLLGFGPASLSFKQIHEDLSQRESLLLIYFSLLPLSLGPIFLPPRHRDFLLHLSAGLGMSPVVLPLPGESLPAGTSGHLDLTTHQASATANLKLKAVGPDTPAELKRVLKHLCQARFEVILLDLDLRQPAAALLVPACESLGFFFAGLLPGGSGAPTLILQYLNNLPLDYDRIQLHSPQAQEILAYVKQVDPNRI
jgi:RimJ/RimL family protein N-acetyltransferase